MTKILALVDGSQYSQSVSDNAAWAAATARRSVELLHVIGRRDTASAPADYSGSLDLGEREQLLKELAEFDEEGRLARKRGRLVLSEARRGCGSAAVETVGTAAFG